MKFPALSLLSLLALACVSEHGPLTNRMAQSATPYLSRAARQPVSWQPWGRDGLAFFGGTYLPLDDPVTGRGLKQLLPDVAKGYREQRAAIVRRADRILHRSVGRPRGAAKPAGLQRGTEAVRGAVEAAARAHAGRASFPYTQ